MHIGTNGILIDQYGRVFLIQRDDTRTLAPPGGGLELGELPTENVAREFREETGLIVMPVRLTGLYFWPMRPEEGGLIFTFRCIMRGGEVEPGEEALTVGFFDTDPLPRTLLGIHRERVMEAWRHAGGPPIWKRQELSRLGKIVRFLVFNLIYPWKNWRRRANDDPYKPPPSWKTGAFTVIRNEQGQVLWVKRRDNGMWNLPGGTGEPMEAPWETAVRETYEETGLHVQLTDLTGVYVKEGALMVFTFTASVSSGAPTTGPESAEFAYFAPGNEPDNSLPLHIKRVADAVNRQTETLFLRQ